MRNANEPAFASAFDPVDVPDRFIALQLENMQEKPNPSPGTPAGKKDSCQRKKEEKEDHSLRLQCTLILLVWDGPSGDGIRNDAYLLLRYSVGQDGHNGKPLRGGSVRCIASWP